MAYIAITNRYATATARHAATAAVHTVTAFVHLVTAEWQTKTVVAHIAKNKWYPKANSAQSVTVGAHVFTVLVKDETV